VHDHASVLAHQRYLPLADLPEEIDRLPRREIQRELELVRRQLLLQRAPQGVLGPEEAVRRHQPLDPLVRAEVVVVGEVVVKPFTGLGEVLRPGTLPQLFPDRFPQSLALA
jgi:hypothetical protein